MRDRCVGVVRDPDAVVVSSLPCPTGIVVATFVAGSMRTTSSLCSSPTQTAFDVVRTQAGGAGTEIVFTTLFVFGLIRDTLAPYSFVTQTAPAP
jgi:hypothetical protein